MCSFKLRALLSIFILVALTSLRVEGEEREELKRVLDKIVNSVEGDNVGVNLSVTFIEGESGDVIYSRGNSSVVPASVLKSVTTATALELFGDTALYRTELYLELNSETPSVIIKGGGDPSLGSKYFKSHYGNFISKWADAITGSLSPNSKPLVNDILLDMSYYRGEPIPRTWQWEDIGNYYGAGVSALTCYDNQISIKLKSGERGSIAEVSGVVPHIEDIDITSYVESEDISNDRSYIFAAPFSNKLVIRGAVPMNRSEFSIKGVLPSPHLFLASKLKGELESRGVKVLGEISTIQDEDSYYIRYVKILETASPELLKISKETNYRSVNLFAEHLFTSIGLHYGATSFKESGCFISDFWSDRGVDCRGWSVADGSGLSRTNSIRTTTLCSILRYMGEVSSLKGSYIATLPKVGVEGSVAYYYRGEPFSRGMRAKSGSMAGVLSLAGVMKSKKGLNIYFSVTSNNHSVSTSKLRKQLSSMYQTVYQMGE